MKKILGSFFTGNRASCVFLFVLTLGIFNEMSAQSSAEKNDLPELAEKEIIDSKKVQFENRSNKVASKEVHIEQINYGKNLASKILKENFLEEEDITVKRIYGDQSGNLGADIIILGEDFSFGHINSLVRLLTGYLMESFEYSYGDARMLSNIIIFYNAIIRKDIEHVQKRYNSLVVTSLNPNYIGIDRNFANWAGQTELLIPLQNNLVRPGGKDMNTGELQQQTEESLDDDTLKQLDKTQEVRRQEDKSRLTEKDEEIKKYLQEQEKENLKTEKLLQEKKNKTTQDLENIRQLEEQKKNTEQKIVEEKSKAKQDLEKIKQMEEQKKAAEKKIAKEKAKAEQDLEKIKQMEEQKKAAEKKIAEEKKHQAAIHKQLEQITPKIASVTFPNEGFDTSQKISPVVLSSPFEYCNNNSFSTISSSGFYQKGRRIYINSDTKFSLRASDDISKKIYTRYKIDDSPFKLYNAPFSFSKEGVSDEGEHFIVYHSIDDAGNKEKEKSYFVIIDDSVPQVLMNNKNKKNIYVKDGKIFIQKFDELFLSAKDEFSGVKNIYYKIDNSDLQTYRHPIKVNEENNFSIEYGAEDQLGNKVFSVCKIQIDEQAPEIELLLENEKGSKMSTEKQNIFYGEQSSTFAIVATDKQSGVKQMWFRVDKQGDFVPLKKEIPFATNKKHVIEIKAVDNVGNIAIRQFSFNPQ